MKSSGTLPIFASCFTDAYDCEVILNDKGKLAGTTINVKWVGAYFPGITVILGLYFNH